MVGSTLGYVRRSGIHRVVVEAARALATRADLHLVRYDALEGGLRHLDADEIDDLFGPGDWPANVRVDPRARRIGRPFREGFDRSRPTWLLAPEVAWHEPQGTEKLARAISQCRVWGVRAAHIFHDLIPISNPLYQGAAAPHAAYMAELVRADLILPNSTHSGDQLAAYWAAQGLVDRPPIAPALLPDGGFSRAAPRVDQGPSSQDGPIIMIGTVEPRKRQMQVLKAFAAARTRSAEAARRKMVVIGSIAPPVADDFNAFIARNTWVDYRSYVSDAELAAAYATAAFSVFASDDEGYGLPISESLSAGAPCLCANFGAMAEIAEGGGCFTVDVRDEAALEAALVTLCEQSSELARLHREIAARTFKTWGDYADALLKHMAERDGAAIGEDEAAQTSQRRRIAAAEAAYRTACLATVRRHPLRPIFLRVLISTYNRRDFVMANVKWLLKSVIPMRDIDIDLVVVDGGSSDGAVQALRQIDDPRFTLVESPVNVGWLGGWREAAKLRDALYVWTLGDDDFIRPSAFGAVVKALKANVGVPLAAVNVGVYDRPSWGPSDHVEDILAEAQSTVDTPAQSGLIPMAWAAEQHAAMFTTLSAIIWRADVLSTAFDRAFDQSPVSGIIEAAPWTDIILGQYGACDILSWGPPALATNANASGSDDRPVRPGPVMPQAPALARDVGRALAP
jgi:glycosyltransferase involved in cell wall biosynthesis